jgi:hypothetical protein
VFGIWRKVVCLKNLKRLFFQYDIFPKDITKNVRFSKENIQEKVAGV